MFKEVDIECYQPPSDVAYTTGKTSYVYADKTGVEKSVAITGNDTVLKSLLGTGTDMDKDYPKSKPSGTKSSSPAATSEVATIPGLSGAGPGTDGTRGGGDDDSGSSSSDDGSGGSATSGGSGASSTGIGGFSQGDQKGTSNAIKVEGMVTGSMVAVLMALAGMLIL